MSVITKIEVQKKNNKRVNIFIDEEYSFSCDAELVFKHDLKIRKNIDINHIKEIAAADNYIKGKNDALKYLERGYKTTHEIEERLLKKGYEKDVINKIIEFLSEYNFIDDNKYVQMYINDKIATSSKKKIVYDLSRKGINIEIINSVLYETNQEDEINGARQMAMKKYNILVKSESDERKLSQKLMRFLMSKGYKYEMIKKIIEDILDSEIDY